MEKVKLTPIDIERCQAKISDANIFGLGGRQPKYLRCEEIPTVIVSEKLPGKDGLTGAMSLCNECLIALKKQNDIEDFNVEILN